MIAPPSPTLSDSSCLSDTTCFGSVFDEAASPKADFADFADLEVSDDDDDDCCSETTVDVDDDLPASNLNSKTALYAHFFGNAATGTTSYPLVAELVNGHGVVQQSEIAEQVEVADESESEEFEAPLMTSKEALHKHFFGSAEFAQPLVAELINGHGVVQQSKAITPNAEARLWKHFFGSCTTFYPLVAGLSSCVLDDTTTLSIPTASSSSSTPLRLSAKQARPYTHFFGQPDPTSAHRASSQYSIVTSASTAATATASTATASTGYTRVFSALSPPRRVRFRAPIFA